MARKTYDLQQYVLNNFDHTNVTFDHAETKADPTIEIGWLPDTVYAYNFNGRIVFEEELKGTDIEQGEVRHEVDFITGFIKYESKVAQDDIAINGILAELTRILNVNNNLPSRNYKWTVVPPTEFNQNPVMGEIEFTIRSVLFDQSAIS